MKMYTSGTEGMEADCYDTKPLSLDDDIVCQLIGKAVTRTNFDKIEVVTLEGELVFSLFRENLNRDLLVQSL